MVEIKIKSKWSKFQKFFACGEYLRTPRDSAFPSPSTYWNDPVNTAKFPHLKILVTKYLSAPATSAESERLFSSAKLAIGDLRTQMSAENLEKQLFIHHNTLILGFE